MFFTDVAALSGHYQVLWADTAVNNRALRTSRLVDNNIFMSLEAHGMVLLA